MKKEELNHKFLSKSELDNLKDIYIISKLNSMNENDLRAFVKAIIQDQIKGTVGDEEEREAWKEMKDFFKDFFEEKVIEIKKKSLDAKENNLTDEEIEYKRRLKLLELQKESESKSDMWDDE